MGHRRKRKGNELTRDIIGFGATGVGLTVGSAVVSSVGAGTAVGASVGAGIATGASFMPAVASLIAVKHIVKQTRKLQPRRRR